MKSGGCVSHHVSVVSGPGVAHYRVCSGGAARPDGLPAADPGAEDTTRGVREQPEAAADSSGSSGRHRSALDLSAR